MQKYNNLTIEVYTRGIYGYAIPIANMDARTVSNLVFDTFYPGGMYGSASFFVPQEQMNAWVVYGSHRIVIRNSMSVVYEGYISSIDRAANNDNYGIVITCVGAWGDILEKQGVNKPWADTRTTSNVWVPQQMTVEEKFDYKVIDGKMHCNPNYSLSFSSGDYQAIRYSAPAGQTVKRIAYTYDFIESGTSPGSWEESFWRSTNGSSWTQMTNASGETYATGTTTVITATGSASVDVTLATPSRYIEWRFYARGTNTPSADNHTHGMVYDITVYTETGSITADAIIEDVVGLCADINSTVDKVSGPSLTLPSYVTSGYSTYAKIINDVLGFGNSTSVTYAAYLRESEFYVSSPNGTPVLVVEQWPSVVVLYEYEISLRDKNIVSPVVFSDDYSTIVNYVNVKYTDEDGVERVVTPDDDATLTDSTSVTRYGTRLPPGGYIDAGDVPQSQAIDYGTRYLNAYKDFQRRISSPVTVSGYIRTGGNTIVPASSIKSGKRVLFSDFRSLSSGVISLSDNRLIAVITATSYNDADETCSLTFGDISPLW